jgi:hypothetical protein
MDNVWKNSKAYSISRGNEIGKYSYEMELWVLDGVAKIL